MRRLARRKREEGMKEVGGGEAHVVAPESSRVRQSDGKIGKNIEHLIVGWFLECEEVTSLMYGEEKGLCGRGTDDVGRREELPGPCHISQQISTHTLDSDKACDKILCLPLMTIELLDLRVCLENGFTSAKVRFLLQRPEKITIDGGLLNAVVAAEDAHILITFRLITATFSHG